MRLWRRKKNKRFLWSLGKIFDNFVRI